MTDEEKKLWYGFLKDCSVRFYRQRIFENYIVDFYCPSAKLVIEIDGSQHFEDIGQKSDMERDAYFYSLGITVMRFSNLQINQQFEAVKNTIYEFIR